MIFRKEPFFYGHDNYDQLVKIAKASARPPSPPVVRCKAECQHDLIEGAWC